MKKTISFYTLGCRSNQSETAVLENLCKQHGFTLIPENQESDIAVINTCTVTEKSDSDTRRLVSKICRLNKKVKIALIGCQAQTQKEELVKFSNVRWVIGNAKKMQLPEIIAKPENNQQEVLVSPISKEPFTMPASGTSEKRTRANIKIQDGCDSFCAYCEVPYARGNARSREFDDIIKEAKNLAAFGHKEIVLTGINLGAYHFKKKTINDVIKEVMLVDGIKRIRISSIEPNTIPSDLILLMASNTKLCRYLHIPIQSACDEILSSMKRHYTANDLDLFLQFAAQNIPEICIGADVIVGFPGETDRFFERTYEFFEQAPISYFHTFSYSTRKFAESKNFPNQVTKKTIVKRSQYLRELSERKKNSFTQKFIGTRQKVLFEERKNKMWTGLTDNYLRVYASSDKDLRNQLCRVSIDKIKSGSLFGQIQ
ncbi:MAG: tRNA (N(6)-L-threonylcarbamoyladenosine(37)-C(2))-methylthiotransferase MtaB [Candidatus Omnitrophica bacterium]|nr:tRNA (N(6)-L-threonylcarbamoyladenosine(37)-C(2))-methylthiotransferase MtaB [Candidatus Omnitrophota bacterium]